MRKALKMRVRIYMESRLPATNGAVMNNTGLMMQNPSNATTSTPTPSMPTDAANAPAADGHSADPVLARLKQLEEANASFQAALDQSKTELKQRDDKIEFLSADKRREMQELIDSGIERWLTSLTGVSAENKKQFKDGVQEIAKKADATNAAWEIVCNASQTHEHNVKEIERLIQLDENNRKTINELRGFKSEASRIGTQSTTSFLGKRDIPSVDDAAGRNVRGRSNDEPIATAAAMGPRDAWTDFASMMSQDYRSNYYR